MDATRVMERKTTVAEGTHHYIFADQEQPDQWVEAITWKNMQDTEFDRILETILALFENSAPQRITISCLNQYVTTTPVAKITALVDDVVSHLTGTIHQVSFPTLLYLPSNFYYWRECKEVNDYLRKTSSEHNLPTLNLSRSFVQRQGSQWVVASSLFKEFRENTGFGTELTPHAFHRYYARLLRFHETAYDCDVPYSTPEADPAPLPLHQTNAYTKKEYTRSLLVGLGYSITLPKQVKSNEKNSKMYQAYVRHLKEQEERKQAQDQDKDQVEDMEVETRGVKRPSAVPVGRGRGKTERREYETMPVLKKTMWDMLTQIAELKEAKKDLEKQLAKERKLRESGDADYYRQKRQLRGAEIRYGELNRTIERISEDSYRDNLDWKSMEKEWKAERKELQQRLDDERRVVGVLEGKVQVYELALQGKSKGATKGKRTE